LAPINTSMFDIVIRHRFVVSALQPIVGIDCQVRDAHEILAQSFDAMLCRFPAK
ncbi:MAG: hypothetical protein LQ340_006400, partial [Diploschistes diacapsis]